MVFALIGSALAAQRDNVYREDGNVEDIEAESVTAVQQHTVFVEIIAEKEKKVNETEIHQFAAVVGLVKQCIQEERNDRFDNAVLWFNDQFLFGDKENNQEKVNDTKPDERLGVNNDAEEENGTQHFYGAQERNPGPYDERWGGCYIPDGFVHAIGKDDPFGCGAEGGLADVEETRLDCGDLGQSNIDVVEQLISLDGSCAGCIFEYQGSFFVTDPNGHDWIVDKHVYPLSVMGNLFQEQSGNDDCASGNGAVPFSDPRTSAPHHDTCTDQKGEDDKKNHCKDSDDDDDCLEDGNDTQTDPENGPALVEPLFTVHQQVNEKTNTGYADTALYQTTKGTEDNEGDDELRRGAPYPRSSEDVNNDGDTSDSVDNQEDDLYSYCRGSDDRENDYDMLSPAEKDRACAIEYTFLIAVDFAAFDNTGLFQANGEDERSDDSREHGPGGANETDGWWEGNSHPHNPNCTNTESEERNGSASRTGTNCQRDDSQRSKAGPHAHDTVSLDLFFTLKDGTGAPYFVEQNPYWDASGNPVDVTRDCAKAQESDEDYTAARNSAIEARTPIVCDVDVGGYHDGTEIDEDNLG
jgi:hypothetical protein